MDQGEDPMTTALVTGGGGFLGGAIIDLLLEKGWTVRSYSRSLYPSLQKQGVQCLQGDLTDAAAVAKACDGVDVVFHVAAKAGMWGPYEDYYQANVVGTKNVITACQQAGVSKLVYTSSPSVVFDGSDMEGVDESVPYPDHYESHYPKTKAEAEKAVLAVNSEKLLTCSLRPHLIWGPGDNHLIPRIVDRARKGQLRIIGDGKNKVDTVFVENAALAHLQAAEKLAAQSPVAGKAYFITNDEPKILWDIINDILKAAGEKPITRHVPKFVAYGAGWIFETVYGLFGIESEPRMTRWVASELTTNHWFDISAAKNDFGYEPKISMAEGMKKLADWFANQRNN